MQFYPSFNFNYPFDKKKPKWFPNQSMEIIQKANIILKKRKPKEIEYAFLTINWIRENTNRKMFYESSPLEEGKEKTFVSDFGNYERKDSLSPTKHLEQELNTFDISDQAEFRNASISDYLAVLAIALISELFNGFNFSNPKIIKDKNQREIDDLKTAGAILIDAKEAICLSEHLSKRPPKKEIVTKEAKELNSLKHRENAIKGNKPKHSIGQSFLDFHRANNFSTDIAAINSFRDTLSEKQKEILPQDDERFFRRVLRNFKNSLNS